MKGTPKVQRHKFLLDVLGSWEDDHQQTKKPMTSQKIPDEHFTAQQLETADRFSIAEKDHVLF